MPVPQWIIDLVDAINAALVDDHLDPADVGYARKRRMAYDARWPTRRQMEAHADAATGDATKRNLMMAEFEVIKAMFPKT